VWGLGGAFLRYFYFAPGPYRGGVRGTFLRHFDSFSRLLPFNIS
jgi:hypothetical protein